MLIGNFISIGEIACAAVCNEQGEISENIVLTSKGGGRVKKKYRVILVCYDRPREWPS